ncbi:hypothetical protein BAUCODRAFT_39764 [Baudoinia panamericana UAMH 10762]|uniref:Uncharacterized protein n=1 Tax=Baudoinia panamericana (strain UAMH 10762) TaxID=717646 RepID=M2LAX6_BAUPA|nr:uncharacterized protein BAUCODRAFT_39764 [Baudoinia panamericana UAMH 10762]EMC90967.1 hypothetical protein BAUCODRAFT_39764 [Baudoinia panamericana UAMH 10762]
MHTYSDAGRLGATYDQLAQRAAGDFQAVALKASGACNSYSNILETLNIMLAQLEDVVKVGRRNALQPYSSEVGFASWRPSSMWSLDHRAYPQTRHAFATHRPKSRA